MFACVSFVCVYLSRSQEMFNKVKAFMKSIRSLTTGIT